MGYALWDGRAHTGASTLKAPPMTDISAYFTAQSPAQLIGLCGFIFYIGSFGAVQLGRMSGNGIAFSAANVAAAVCVGISLTVDFNLASALIQGSWIVMGLVGIGLRMRMRVRAAQIRKSVAAPALRLVETDAPERAYG